MVLVACIYGDQSAKTGGVYAEKWADFTKELAVMVVRSDKEVGRLSTLPNTLPNTAALRGVCAMVKADVALACLTVWWC